MQSWRDGGPDVVSVEADEGAGPGVGPLAGLRVLDPAGVAARWAGSRHTASVTIDLLGSEILEWTANGELAPWIGNRSRDSAPHGCVPLRR